MVKYVLDQVKQTVADAVELSTWMLKSPEIITLVSSVQTFDSRSAELLVKSELYLWSEAADM